MTMEVIYALVCNLPAHISSPDGACLCVRVVCTLFVQRKITRVIPRGIGAQLPGDRENNLDAIDAVKYDTRWAVSRTLQQRHGERTTTTTTTTTTMMTIAHRCLLMSPLCQLPTEIYQGEAFGRG